MPITDVLQRHWKKLAILGLVVAIGVCVAIGLAVTKDVEQPEDEQLAEGGNAGAQQGGPGPSGDVTVINGVRVPPQLRSFNKENVVPNFFERTRNPATGELVPPDDFYRGGLAVMLQNQNSGGQLMKLCLREMGVKNDIVTDQNFAEFYDDLKMKKDEAHEPGVVVGECVLGTCDYTQTGVPCSYFTIISDPYDRAVTTYIACLANRANCGGIDPETVSLTQWAKDHGSYLLHQVLQSHASCDGEANLDEAMDGIEQDALDMAYQGLERWFAVVCTTADMDGCLRMLENVYGMPFYEKCGGERLVDLKQMLPKSAPPSRDVVEKLKSQVLGGGAADDLHDLVNQLKAQLRDAGDDVMHADVLLSKRATVIVENEKGSDLLR